MAIERDVPLDILLSQRRHARWNFSINRNLNDLALRRRGHQGSGLARVALKKTFPFQRSEVLHNGSLTGKTKMLLDLTRARSQSLTPLFRLDKLQDVSLSRSEHLNMFVRFDRIATTSC